MKYLFVIMLLFAATIVTAQEKSVTSDRLTISGKIKTEIVYTPADLDTFKNVTIGDVEFSDANESKYKVHNIKGILLKDLLSRTEFLPENHKALNKFYFVFEAPDDFKVVFSYNEIFHPKGSANFYLVTGYDEKNINDMNERILIISCNDMKSGHKFIKGLSRIVVKEAD